MSVAREQNIECKLVRLERQAQRIRNRLAKAWDSRSPKAVIHRIEDALRRRWRELDEARQPPE